MSAFQEVVRKNETAILSGWMSELANATRRSDLIKDADLKSQASELLRLFTDASQTNSDVQSDAFANTREFLKDIADGAGIYPSGNGDVRSFSEAAGI
jgi:rsbT co-antagonist protein RsbR